MKINDLYFVEMVSTLHSNASFYFERDIQCVRRFFKRRFNFEADDWPKWERDVDAHCGILPSQDKNDPINLDSMAPRLDRIAEASGFSKKLQKEIEKVN